MGMKESWGLGVLASILAFIGSFIGIFGIGMLAMEGRGIWMLLIAAGLFVGASYLWYLSSHSVRVVELPQAAKGNSPNTLTHTQKLEQLNEMLSKGLITAEEYEIKKQKVLESF